jgi:D-glycero-D-manno-heptose 1,7-bisphosphate phosphatase
MNEITQLRKAVFFDKDGTLVIDVPYNVDCARISLAPGALEATRRLSEAGFLIVIVSNQSGVARGCFPIQALMKVEDHLRQVLADEAVPLAGFYFCPHHPEGVVTTYSVRCECRKPGPGMLRRAAAELNIDLAQSWLFGDILDDIEAGHRAGCRSILCDVGSETQWEQSPLRTPDHVVSDLQAAADVILSQGTSSAAEPQLVEVSNHG